jgi:hypothetical protein
MSINPSSCISHIALDRDITSVMRHEPLLLCIDDEMRPLIMRQLLLESEGYRVIKDQLLVRTTGAELAAKLKNLRPGIPILLLTGAVLTSSFALIKLLISKQFPTVAV